MAAVDLEAEYDNRRRVPGHGEMQARWTAQSEAYVGQVKGEVDQGYGSGPRHKYDLFRPKSAGGNTPLVVYIHGGYWQRGDRKMYAFLAKELNARGIAVAIPSYSLCPVGRRHRYRE